MSGKGWTDQDLFKNWLKNQYAISGRPLLLLADGHSSRYEPSSAELAKENDITLICLPPHISEAWLLALTPANIVSGFRKCGIYPFLVLMMIPRITPQQMSVKLKARLTVQLTVEIWTYR